MLAADKRNMRRIGGPDIGGKAPLTGEQARILAAECGERYAGRRIGHEPDEGDAMPGHASPANRAVTGKRQDVA
jgi:hypothetical protein